MAEPRKAKPAEISNTANQKALGNIRARVIEVTEDVEKRLLTSMNPAKSVAKRFNGEEPGKSETMPEDPFSTMSSSGEVIEPPFDMLTLAMLEEHSTELGQCLEAMMMNIDGFGHRQKPRVKDDPENPIPEALAKEVNAERVRLVNFFEYATEESFVEFRKRIRKDLESTGNAYFEVIRGAAGDIQQFKHIPSYQMRLTRQDEKAIQVDRPILELQEDGSIKVTTIKEWRRFRRYVQSRSIHRRNLTMIGDKKRWFKAFGDPRQLHNDTGKFLGAPDGPSPSAIDGHEASEVVHLCNYSPRSPYGVPRYVGNLLSIFGDRAAEEINYITFRNNNIPSMALLVSNGQLTEGTIERISSFVESQIQGSDNYSKFLIVEAETTADDGEDAGQIKMDIKPLTKDQHDDALFQNYSANNQDKIRRAFRLPPIFVGRSDDYTRATAESSRRLADEQIFAPERDEWDKMMNRILYPAMGIKYHKFCSNSPNTTDNEQLVRILAGAEKTGGMTPRIARLLLSDILSLDIMDDFPAGFPRDVPFSLTMAEAVKNEADPAEPGQQVTAVKAALMGEDYEPSSPLIKHLLDVRKGLEESWEAGRYTDQPVADPEVQE